MREIKFRGRDEHGRWHFGDLLSWPIIRSFNGWNYKYKEVAAETVGQFTGLRDSTGKKIYEGDIVRVKDEDELDAEASLGVVKYYAATACYPAFDIEFLKPDQDGRYLDCNALAHFVANCGIEVIGNIHNNPELLEAHA